MSTSLEGMATADGLQGDTVLVVDDNATNLGIIANFLDEYGFDIMVARNGESGIEKVHHAPPDLILLDVMMPGIDGFETCRRLKADKTTRDIPVIFMTALATEADKIKGFEAGAVDYITKPIQQGEMLARVITHLRIQHLTKSLQRRAVQLQAGSLLGQQVTSILDQDRLLPEVVQLIQSRFDYYFVGIWLLTEQGDICLQVGKVRHDLDLLGPDLCMPPGNGRGIIGQVCRTGQYYLTEDVTRDDNYVAIDALPDTHSELALPLRVGDRMIGALDIRSDQGTAFDQQDKTTLQMLADQIAIAIRNASLYQREQSRRKLAETLQQVGQALTSTLDLNTVLDLILKRLHEIVPYDQGAILLHRYYELEFVTTTGFPYGSDLVGSRIALDTEDHHNVFAQICHTKQPLSTDNVPVPMASTTEETTPQTKTWLGIPLLHRDDVIGILALTRETPAAYDQEDVALITAFAAQAAVALQNARLYERITRFNQQLEYKVQERTEELQVAYEQLEQLDRVKSDFIQIASHELRTPLSVMNGYSQLLKDGSIHSDEEYSRIVDGLESSVERLHEIVQSLLDIAKIDNRELKLYPEPVDVCDIIESVGIHFSDVLQKRKLVMEIRQGMTELTPIEADSEALYKIFYHLIINAIKYTPDGGKIWIDGHPRSLGDREDQPLHGIEIIVGDTGIGIDPSVHELIFDKFYQTGQVALHSSGKTKFKGGGPGLGLAIVKGIVSAHGGKVWVESPGHDEKALPGSRFHVVLPLRQDRRK